MKLKIFIITFLLFISKITTFADLSKTDGVEPLTSGINGSYYEITWCSPHTELSQCEKGYFYKDGNVGVLTYKGENFKNGNVELNKTFPAGSRTSDLGIIDFFSGITSLKFEGEGIYTIKVLLYDYAYNASVVEFSYKIDKTAPQLMLSSISENTPYTYAGGRISNLNGNVYKYDSVDDISNDLDKYPNPNGIVYTGDIPVERKNHNRQNLYSFYFKNLDSENFNVNVSYSDNYNGHLVGSDRISGEKNFALLDEENNILQNNLSLNSSISLLTSYLNKNTENSQKKYKLRLYDNTVGKDSNKTPNYSEIVFYAVRDNTKPNMGANGLASNEIDAVEKILKFDNTTTAWDKTTNGYNPTTNGFSKFIATNDAQNIYSTLYDIGIGSSVSQPELYNAGLDTTNQLKVSIQKANDLSNFDDTIVYNNRFTNDITQPKDFSNVDLNRQFGYRKYQTKFSSPGIEGQICDLVGNCLNTKMDFRVVASGLDNGNSNISLKLGSQKIVANGQDKYIIESKIEDKFRNKIVGVVSQENIGKPTIKEVDTYFDFQNGLNINQNTDTPNGARLVSINDLQNDNEISTTQTINQDNSNIYFKEIPGTGINGGIYSFEIKSKVPTNGLYPYLSQSSKLALKNIKPKAFGTPPQDITYPPTGDRLGFFNKQSILSGNDNFLSYDDGGITAGDSSSDLKNFSSQNYGNITLRNSNDVKYNTLNSRKLELEFASPYVYGAKDFSLAPLYSFNAFAKHTKQIYTISDIPSVEKIYERYLSAYSSVKHVNGVVNFDYKNVDIGNVNGGNLLSKSYIEDLKKPNGYDFEIKASPALSFYQDSKELKFGYISYLTYKIGDDEVYIPSISRNTSDKVNGGSDSKLSSRFYFTSDEPYAIIGDGITNFGAGANLGIAVNGLTNKNNVMTDNTAGTKANVNIYGDLTKYDLITTFKQNVSKNSAGLNSSNGLNWCENLGTINQNFLNDGDGKNCTIDINGEKISFIKGNVDIKCGIVNGGTCKINNKKRTIIVQDGYTYIKSNISTYGTQNQLLIGTVAENGLKNISIPNNLSFDLNLVSENIKGWTIIDKNITNIDSYIVSQGPVVSYDEAKTKLYGNTIESDELRNQLHIYGSLLSLNTVGGFKDEGLDYKCPYIINNCTSNLSGVFDLVFLRRFNLIGQKFYDETETDSNKVVAYHPNGNNIAKRSGAKVGPFRIADNETCDDLRCILDPDYKKYPLFIQRDKNWNTNPSIMFRTDR